jgi:hypothetical protein
MSVPATHTSGTDWLYHALKSLETIQASVANNAPTLLYSGQPSLQARAGPRLGGAMTSGRAIKVEFRIRTKCCYGPRVWRRRRSGFDFLVLITLLLLLPAMTLAAVADTQEAPSRAQGECNRPFPKSPAAFVRKLLLVAQEPDPFQVPQKFEEAFRVKLRGTRAADGETFSYSLLCSWYTSMSLGTFGDDVSNRHVSLWIGQRNTRTPLLFAEYPQCLEAVDLSHMLEAKGWSGGQSGSPDANLTYHKSKATIYAALGGRIPGEFAHPACVQSIKVTFRKAE